MPEGIQKSPPDLVVEFCAAFVSFQTERWPPEEDILADAVLAKFQTSPLVTPEQLENFGRALGIQVSILSLPPEIAGLNCTYLSQRAIYLTEKEAVPGAMAHTFFHELREILEGVFISLNQPTGSAAEMENRAEKFAVAARMESMNKYLLLWMQEAEGIEVKWQRWGAFILLAVLMLANGLFCVSLPRFEEEVHRKNRKS